MSTIKGKAFDPSLKIARTEFRGYPNLITSSDLNRQVEGLAWRANQVEALTGLETDFKMTNTTWGTGSKLNVTFSYTSIYCRGCKFTPDVSSSFTTPVAWESPADGSDLYIYVHLTAKSKVSTFADGNMNIAGAEFEDGTTLEAADQVVYYDEKIVLSTGITGITDSIGILGAVVKKQGITNDLFFANNTDGVPMAIQQKDLLVETDYRLDKIESIVAEAIARKINPRRFQAWVQTGVVKLHSSYATVRVFQDGIISDTTIDVPANATPVAANSIRLHNTTVQGGMVIAPIELAGNVEIGKDLVIRWGFRSETALSDGTYKIAFYAPPSIFGPSVSTDIANSWDGKKETVITGGSLYNLFFWVKIPASYIVNSTSKEIYTYMIITQPS